MRRRVVGRRVTTTQQFVDLLQRRQLDEAAECVALLVANVVVVLSARVVKLCAAFGTPTVREFGVAETCLQDGVRLPPSDSCVRAFRLRNKIHLEIPGSVINAMRGTTHTIAVLTSYRQQIVRYFQLKICLFFFESKNCSNT